MGTDSSPTATSPSATVTSRPLWQVPVFLMGVATLVAVWVTRMPADIEAHQLAHLLARARQILSRPDGDAETAAKTAQQALDLAGPDDERTGEAYFLLGTAYMRQADRASDDASARPHWLEARHALEEAERLGVPKDDQGHLRYRLGKIGFHTGDNPRRVADCIASSAEQAEDRAEAYDLLAQAYLRLTPPDYQKALDANTKLREQSLLRDEMLAKVKLRSGELKLKLRHAEEARKDLELIGPAAPPTILAQARLLRAQSYQEEENPTSWKEAAVLWQAALKDSHEPVANRPVALYSLGVCHRKLDQIDDAIRVWDECIHSGPSAESIAASVQLAELRLDRKDYSSTLDLLTSAVSHVQKPSEWNNPYIECANIVDVFEKTAKVFCEAGQYKLALQLADPFKRLAPPGRAALLQAEAAAGYARKCKDQIADKGNKSTPEDEQAMLDLFRTAGTAFLEAATVLPQEAQTDLLWQAANCYVEGQDSTQAISTIERYLKVEKRPDHLSEGWFILGEAYRQLKEPNKAEQAYLTCISYPPTRFAYRARYQLAMLNSQNGLIDEAVEILEKNLTYLLYDPDEETREKSLFALGNLSYQRHDYSKVRLRLEEALSQFPANSEATRARYQLADSYRHLANDALRDAIMGDTKDARRIKIKQEQYKNWLEKAATEYKELADFLEKPESAGHLTPEERDQVPFIAADCLFNLGKYQDALEVYEKLIDANANRPTVMVNALVNVVRCYWVLGQQDKLHQRVEQIRKALASLDIDKTLRQQLEDWLVEAEKPMTPGRSVSATHRED